MLIDTNSWRCIFSCHITFLRVDSRFLKYLSTFSHLSSRLAFMEFMWIAVDFLVLDLSLLKILRSIYIAHDYCCSCCNFALEGINDLESCQKHHFLDAIDHVYEVNITVDSAQEHTDCWESIRWYVMQWWYSFSICH